VQSQVIDKLKGIQEREGMSDMKMAQRLVCSRQLYQATRTGKLPVNNKIIRGILKAFPELEQDVIYFLSYDDKMLAGIDNNSTEQLSEPQGRGLKRFCVGLLGKLIKRAKHFNN